MPDDLFDRQVPAHGMLWTLLEEVAGANTVIDATCMQNLVPAWPVLLHALCQHHQDSYMAAMDAMQKRMYAGRGGIEPASLADFPPEMREAARTAVIRIRLKWPHEEPCPIPLYAVAVLPDGLIRVVNEPGGHAHNWPVGLVK